MSCALVCALGTVECWGGRQGGCGPELCVRRLRVCGSQLAVCLVSLLCLCVARACRHHLSSVHPYRDPRRCPVRAWLFFTFLHTYVCVYTHTHTQRPLPQWGRGPCEGRDGQSCTAADDGQRSIRGLIGKLTQTILESTDDIATLFPRGRDGAAQHSSTSSCAYPPPPSRKSMRKPAKSAKQIPLKTEA